MTKRVTKINKYQKLFLVGAVLVGAAGLFASKARSADLLYSNPKQPHGIITDSGWYLAARGGVGFGEDFSGVSFDNSYGFSGAVGYDFGQFGLGGFRIEGETGFLTQDAQLGAPWNGSVDALYGLLNAYADIDTGSPFTPFIGGGVGYTRVTADVSNGGGFNLQATDSDFTWNATAGVSYEISRNVSIEGFYRYLAIQDVQFSTPFGSVTDDVNSQQINAGLRVKL